jgi:hypothetical protein
MAWHASPYDFDKFGEMKKTVGTGQGASSYGKGAAYVAESRSVSGPGRSEYMEEFAKHPASVGEKVGGFSMAQIQDDMTPNNWRGFSTANLPHPFNTLSTRAFELISEATYAHALHGGSGAKSLKDQVNRDADQLIAEPDDYTTHGEDAQFLIAAAKEAKAFIEKHHTSPKNSGPYSYQVAVHLTPETMLDWDSVLGDHHEQAQKKLAPLQHMMEGTETLSDYDLSQMDEEDRKAYEEDKSSRGFTNPNKSGQDFYHDLMRHFDKGGVDIGIAASEALYNAGIHGIRYLDGLSRQIPPELKYNDKPIGKYLNELAKSDKVEPKYESLNLIAKVHRQITHGSMNFDQLKKVFESNRPLPIHWEFDSDVLSEARDLLKNEASKFSTYRPSASYNYVIFHPDFVEALSQYNIKGDKVKDFGPGVHLKSVEHDPFKDEGK